MTKIHNQDFMSLALQLAERGIYTTSPNPAVGCVIVKNNQIIGSGYHIQAGTPHAEIHALNEAGQEANGATAYITLEPCCHQGKTPPCTNALIQAGIKKISVACLDPNPLVAGKGIAAIRVAGIEVEIGNKEKEAQALNEAFFHYIKYKRPFVIAKWAMSLDGKTITHGDDDRTISNEAANMTTHEIRQRVDAILIGSQTAISDNPLLTVRKTTNNSGKQPLRIILASHGLLPLNLKLFDPNMPGKTIIATTHDVDKNWLKQISKLKVETLQLAKNSHGQVDLHNLLNELGKREIMSVLVEGGMQVHHSFFNENLVNKIHVFLAPVIIGNLPKKQMIANLALTQLDNNFYFTAKNEDLTHV